MRVLIIDPSEEFRLLMSQYLAIEWPDVIVEDYGPIIWGKPWPNLPRSEFNVVLLGSYAGSESDQDWLVSFIADKRSPPVIFVFDKNDGRPAIKALKKRAVDYLYKQDLNRVELVRAIVTVLAKHPADASQHLFNTTATPLDSLPEITAEPDNEGTFFYQNSTKPITIKNYRVLREIGTGGVSVVYLAERITDEQPLALKILDSRLTSDQIQLERFIQEYAIISSLQNSAVVKIYEQGFTDDRVYIAMEYFANGDLKKILPRMRSPRQAMSILVKITRALQSIHVQGVIHRDIKPSNIMIRHDGSLALVDFGCSNWFDVQNPHRREDNRVMGTIFYMSPEQCRGLPVDRRGDLYSLGIIFYQLLIGALPYTGNAAPEVMNKHFHAPVPKLPKALADYQELLQRLLAKSPENRFQSADELLEYIDTTWGLLGL